MPVPVAGGDSITPETPDQNGGRSTGWQVIGTRIIYTLDSRVGIGTGSPAYPLHIRSDDSRGIYVDMLDTSGTQYAGYFRARSVSGRALVGNATADTGTAIGVMGISSADRGRGGQFMASADSGRNMGIYVQTNSPEGYAIYVNNGRSFFDGRVGIGMANPRYDADVNGTLNADAILINGEPIQGGNGDITAVNAGTGLSGGGDSGSVTLHLDTDYTDGRYMNDGQDASGDLTGSYPNPQVDGLRGRSVSSTSPSSGEVLKWYNNQWTPRPDETGGGGGGSLWLENGGSVYRMSNVGIWNSSPTYGLEVGSNSDRRDIQVWGQIAIQREGGGNDQGSLRLRDDGGLVIEGEDWLYLDGGDGHLVSCVNPSNGAYQPIEASNFVTRSLRADKREIVALDEHECAKCLQSVLALVPSTYRYRWDDAAAVRHVGLIADEVPSSIDSKDHDGVELYSLCTFQVAAVQELDRQHRSELEAITQAHDAESREMENRIKRLEDVVKRLASDNQE